MAEAPPITSPKIEELRGKLKADPKSRLFYPLAEELRKISQLEQAEQTLRDGLQIHPGYLSAWISLGRILKERERHVEAVEILKKALTLDPGNVVAAKLLAQVYRALGEKVEAIKKFKLVHALMPADEEVEAEILQLDRELNPDKYPVDAPPEPVDDLAEPLAEAAPESSPFGEEPAAPFALGEAEPVAPHAEESAPFPIAPFDATDPSPFASLEAPLPQVEGEAPAAIPPVEPEPSREVTPEPTGAPRLLSPLEYDQATASMVMEQPVGQQQAREEVTEAPASAFTEPEPAAQAMSEGVAATFTMAELYERQGHVDSAISIYKTLLDRDAGNREAATALARLTRPVPDAVEEAVSRKKRIVRKLEDWRSKVARS